MRLAKILSLLIAVIAMSTTSILGQGDIISAKKFMELYKSNDNLVVMDVNSSKGYRYSHIKNAIFVNHADLYKTGDVPNLLKSPSELATYFGNKGVSADNTIVVYDDGSQSNASRVYHILKYIGAKDVKILHKNMSTWRKVRIPLSSTATELTATTFTPNVKDNLLATTSYVDANNEASNVIILDLRSPLEYNGTLRSRGHIPGAINLSHSNLLYRSGAFKSKAELEAIAKELGITPDKELIFSCRTGIRASVGFVAFKNILGYDKVRVYDGSYVEWVDANKELVQ
jgi:thiosulfate/3-mercaptopyruvate sulfurtransferase